MDNPFKDYEPTKSKITSKRQLLIKDLYEIINPIQEAGYRSAKKLKKKAYKPLTPKDVAIRVSLLKEKDLESLIGQCKHAKHPGKYFYWSLRVDKE